MTTRFPRERTAIAAALLVIAWGKAEAQPLVVSHEERSAFQASVRELLLKERFDELESRAQTLRGERRRFASGAPILFDFYEGMNPAGDEVENSKRAPMAVALEKWKERAPRSVTPRVVLVRQHLFLAWHNRGDDWAAGVSKEGWKGYEAELQRAWTVGNEALSFTPRDPVIYDSLLAVAVAQGRPPETLEKLFAAGVQLDPEYEHLYVVMARNLMSRWHGSATELEQFASRAAESTKASMGDQLYARIAAEGMVLYGGGEFETLKPAFPWARLNQAFRELQKAHPNSSLILHVYCQVAARYGDVLTAAHLFGVLGNQWSRDAQDVWQTQQYFEQMRRWVESRTAQFKGPGARG